MITFYAHSTISDDKSEWQKLEDHLRGVTERAAAFADVFGAKNWGRCAGLLHDAGKATGAFQRRLEGSLERVDHATFGAQLAKEKGGPLGLLLAYVLAGHHGGLPDGGEQESQLHFRLKHGRVPEDVKLMIEDDCLRDLPLPFMLHQGRGGFSLTFFTRMLFSCLVDGDFLDTEEFYNPQIAAERVRHVEHDAIKVLQKRMDAHLKHIINTAQATHVNALRKEVLFQCREKAKLPQQIFSIAVPTGGGKTLSSMAFALDHAIEHGLRRVVYAIPFTSIIEQNAQVFQEILGREQVLEHHCNYRETDDPEEAGYNRRRGLAAENWESPVVVSTNVQFFESLFSNKPSKCRKLHNIARSVIVLDEAQVIPTDYLEPCLAALRELVDHYGCTVVLCTATQPAFDDKSSLRAAFPQINEIIDSPSRLFSELKRTNVNFIGKRTDEELAALIEAEQQALCIVATKPQARSVFNRLEKGTGVFHLSTNMYPQHRRRVLEEIRDRLNTTDKCLVVSTSLVEAGVDLDFPVVFRAMAGLDSIAQAAGRCNREGKMDGLGKVFVFEAENKPRMPWLNRCVSKTAEALRCRADSDAMGMQVMRRYFELLFDIEDLDKKKIMRLLNPKRLDKDLSFPFKEVDRAFKFIEEDTIGVVVPRDPEAQQLVQRLRYSRFPRPLLRKLQPYLVAVRSRDLVRMEASGALEMLLEGKIAILRNKSVYREDVGLVVEESDVWEVNELIV